MTVTESVRCYSVAAVAERLSMSQVWVYGEIKAGRLPVVEFGSTRKHQRVRADELQAFIDSRSFGATLPTGNPPALVGVPAYSGRAPEGVTREVADSNAKGRPSG